MKGLRIKGRTLALVGVLAPLLVLFIYVVLSSGPLAPIPVTATLVRDSSITPALFGIGTVEARYAYKIGPTVAGRVKRVDVQVGDMVRVGQVLGEMEPVDLDDRVASQKLRFGGQKRPFWRSRRRSKNFRHAGQMPRRRQGDMSSCFTRAPLAKKKSKVSGWSIRSPKQTMTLARANLDAARQDLERTRSDRDGLHPSASQPEVDCSCGWSGSITQCRSRHYDNCRSGGGGGNRPEQSLDQRAL